MEKRRVINLVLLGLVGVLAVIVWMTPAPQLEETLEPLTPLEPAKVNFIRISNNNGPAFTLERINKQWRMTEPYAVKGNTPRIEILMDLLATPRVETLPLPLDRLAEFGLDRPLAEVQFNDTRLIFGGTHPYNYRRYVRIDNQLHLTNDRFPHHVLARAEDFISHALFEEQQKIIAIETPRWQLRRDERGAWQLLPAAAGITQQRLQEKVDNWQHSWVAKVIEAPAAAAGEPLTIKLEGQPPIRLSLVAEKKGVLLVREDLGLAYRLSDDSLLDIPVGDQPN